MLSTQFLTNNFSTNFRKINSPNKNSFKSNNTSKNLISTKN